jgi:hypothetical protein
MCRFASLRIATEKPEEPPLVEGVIDMSRIDDIVHNISIRTPSLAEYWPHGRQSYTDENGDISVHGVFCVLADYMRDQHVEFTREQLADLWEWIDWQLSSTDETISHAVCSCFLEIVADTDVEESSRQFMSDTAAEYVDQFMGRGRRKKRWFER